MFDLGSFLPYLINRAGARLAFRFNQALRPHGVGVQEWRVLAVLYAHGGQRMSALAQLTSIDRTTLSRLTTRMEVAGLLERRRTEEDGREVHVVLATKGQETTEAILPLAHHYEDVAVSGLSEEEAAQLKRLLAKVYGNLEKL